MSFAGLLRSSRLAALPPTVKSPNARNPFPASAAIQTTRANQAAGDWGLKRTLPRLKTGHIHVHQLDTQEHQTPFTSANVHTKFVKRWQEMGFKPARQEAFSEGWQIGRPQASPPAYGMLHPDSLSKQEAARLLQRARKQRRRFLRRHGELALSTASTAEGSTTDEPTKAATPVYTPKALEQMRRAVSEDYKFVASRPGRVQPNGGLCYHPAGMMHVYNTPEGPQERQLVARHLQYKGKDQIVGFGGLVAGANKAGNNRPSSRATTLPVYPTKATFRQDGSLDLLVSRHAPVQLHSYEAERRTGAAWKDLAERDLTMEDPEDDFLQQLDQLRDASPLSKL